MLMSVNQVMVVVLIYVLISRALMSASAEKDTYYQVTIIIAMVSVCIDVILRSLIIGIIVSILKLSKHRICYYAYYYIVLLVYN